MRLERELLETARRWGVRVIGPNSQGIVNTKLGLSTAFAPQSSIVKGGVAIVCQTGTFVACAKYYSQLVGGVSYIIDLANMCDVSFSDVIEFLGDDPDTRVIALHVEGVRDGRRFMDVARRVSGRKPIVALKSGRSEGAARAIQAHTGSLAGRDEVADAALRQAGVIRVGCLDELVDVAKAFNVLPAMKGKRVAVLTFTGGLGAILVDALEEFGLELAPLSEDTVKVISAMSDSWLKVGNPVDMFTACQNKGIIQAYNAALRAIVEDVNVDGVAVIIPHLTGFIEPRDALENVDVTRKPIIMTGNTAAVDDPVTEWWKALRSSKKLE